MSNVSGSLGSLLGGISQQPAVVRAEGQCEDLLNGMLRPIDGLTDREPFIAVGSLPGMTPSMRLHHWDAGDGSRYIAGVGGGQVRVWDWEGNPISVAVDANAVPYISVDGAYLHTANVGDYLMVSNNTVVAAMQDTNQFRDNPFATVWIKGVRWGNKLTAYFNVRGPDGVDYRIHFAYTPPDGTVSTDTEGSDTSKANNKFLDPSYVIWRWGYHLLYGVPPVDFEGPVEWMDVKHSLAVVDIDYGHTSLTTTAFQLDGSTMIGPNGLQSGWYLHGGGTDSEEELVVFAHNSVTSSDKLPPRSYNSHVIEVTRPDSPDFSYYMKYVAESYTPPPDPEYGTPPPDPGEPGAWSSTMYSHECIDIFQADEAWGADSATMFVNPATPWGQIVSLTADQHYPNVSCGIRTGGAQPGDVTMNIAGHVLHFGFPSDFLDGDIIAFSADSGDEGAVQDALRDASTSGTPIAVYDARGTVTTRATATYGIPTGTWRETHKLGLAVTMNATTLPHALVRLPSGTFRFIVLDGVQIPEIAHTESWAKRTVGDDDSTPLPDFIGGTIRGIGVYKDRMYLYGGESMRFSKIGLYWDLFIESAVEGGDDDGFDVTTVTGKVQNIRYTVPHQQSLVVFAEQGQFMMDGSQVLSPSTAALIPVTSFLLNHDVEPKPAGDVVYFTDKSGKYSHVREFYMDSITATNNARPITQHVDHLIPENVKQIIASAEDGLMVVVDNNGVMYVYQYVVDNGNRVQSAWHVWQVSGYKPLYGWVHRGVLYIVAMHGVDGTYYIGKMDLDSSIVDEHNYTPRLDGLRYATAVNDTLTTTALDAHGFQFQLADGPYKGTVLNPKTISGGVVTFYDNINGMSVAYGSPYFFTFTPTRPFPLDNRGRKITDRLTVMQFLADIENSGPFEAVLRSDYYPDYRIPVDRVLAAPEATLGETPVVSGRAPIMVNMNMDCMTMSFEKLHPQPFNLVNLDYRGRYTQRSTRI